MFTKFNTKFGTTRLGTSKLDRAVILSVIAMVGFNLVVLTQQVNAGPFYALNQSAGAVQA
jgi:hypothetical protein